MKTIVALACVCAVAQAQFGNQYQSSFGSQRVQAQSSFGNQQNINRNQQSSFGNQQNAFRNQQSNQQQQAAPRQIAGSCRELNERYPVTGSCDMYIECINGTAEEKVCPDGLRFNPNVNFNVYPCQYPNDVPCLERSALQPAQPTEDCPHQFGYFKTGDAKNCSGFRNCVNGVGYDFTCPDGLAFSSASYRCDWPDQVEDCDAEAFLGFRCPAIPESRELGAPAGYRFYGSDINCQKYFMCIEGRPRVLSCGGETAFDELTSTCVSADEVQSCPQELRLAAQQHREDEQQRLAKQLEFEAKGPRTQSKRRF